ncbi:GNAT family N-acetyltransferase [Anaerosporobacter faecicola]|uniref:GNAT family N-acetyltransferase n=1 Tax=Anaerosporobacter faecicola TaxID=2718714 RepID=UPI001438B764|nr:GNAT family N-acetyltransferase [Anaerosporobacter faecicola]
MIEIRKTTMDSEDAKALIQELNQILVKITGDDGTTHFQQTDVEQERSVFLIGYIDGEPFACGGLKEISQECGEIKRIYARKNQCQMGRRIIKALEEEAKRLNYQKLVLETRIQNEHAISFYEKNGYIHCEKYGVYRNNENAYCFKKEL